MGRRARLATLLAGSAVVLGGAVAVLQLTSAIALGDGIAARAVEALGVRPRDRLLFRAPADAEAGFANAGNRAPVMCPAPGPRTAVLVTFGQSNAANPSERPQAGLPGVFNLNAGNGNCYFAEDPLLGADGSGGSIWTALGNQLVREGRFDAVVLGPVPIKGIPFRGRL